MVNNKPTKDPKDRGILFHRGAWYVELMVRGRRKRFKCASKVQARTLRMRLKTQILEGRYDPNQYAKRATVGQWLEDYVNGCTNRDVQHERYSSNEWIRRLGKDTALSDITHQQLLAVKKQMVDSGRQEQTVGRYFAFLKKVFNLAIKDHTRTGVMINPVKGITFEKSEQVLKRLSDQQLADLKEIMAPEDYQAVELAIETMLRRGPLFRWRWADIDLERKEFTLLKANNKAKKTLTLPLSEYAVSLLKARLSFGFSPWVFPARYDPNTPRDVKTFYQDIYLPALRKRGIPIPPDRKAWHMLRHTGATRRLLAGCPMPVLRDLLGHSTLAMTERYVNLIKEDLRRGIEQGSLRTTDLVAKGKECC